MKKSIMILSVFATALMLLPCCKEDNDDLVYIRSKMESAALSSSAKTYLGPTADGQTPILWDRADHIGVFDGDKRYEFELESGANTTSAQFTTLARPSDTIDPPYCAIYPTWGNPTAERNGDSYTVTFYLPKEQTYREPINGVPTLGRDALPMLGYSYQFNTFNFSTPMAILKVDLTGTGWVKKMVLTDLNEDNMLWGKASVTMSSETDTPEIHSSDLSEGNNKLSLNCNHTPLSENPTSFYFVVPVGTLCNEGHGFKIDVYDLDNVCHTIDESSVAGDYIHRATITRLAPTDMVELDDIIGIKGLFSVSENKKVYFSQGNLMTKVLLSDGYFFQGKQYLYQPISPVSFTRFGWGEPGNTMPYVTVSMDNGVRQQNIWRVLTAEEWMYLFSYATDGANPYGENYDNDTRRDMYRKGVTVMGNPNCLVLYPDGYAGTKVQDFDTESFDTEAEYEAATAAGIVFLPPAGYFNSAYEGQAGAYWSSTHCESSYNFAYALFFQSQEGKWVDRYVNPKAELSSGGGCSLRLVRDIIIPAE